MAKSKALKGKDLMIFMNGKAIALATNHTLNLSAETSDTSSKDSGVWTESEITGMNWTASSESVCSADEDVNSYEAMLDAMLKMEIVPIKLGIPANISKDEMPEGGWTEPQKYYGGNALITGIDITATNKENATMTVNLTGVGQLKKETGAA